MLWTSHPYTIVFLHMYTLHNMTVYYGLFSLLCNDGYISQIWRNWDLAADEHRRAPRFRWALGEQSHKWAAIATKANDLETIVTPKRPRKERIHHYLLSFEIHCWDMQWCIHQAKNAAGTDVGYTQSSSCFEKVVNPTLGTRKKGGELNWLSSDAVFAPKL
jgi:hypothetical protein